MSKSQYLKLRNGAVIQLDSLQAVIRRGVNDYALVLQHCPVVISADASDVAAVERYMGDQGLLETVPEEQVPPSKLVVPE